MTQPDHVIKRSRAVDRCLLGPEPVSELGRRAMDAPRRARTIARVKTRIESKIGRPRGLTRETEMSTERFVGIDVALATLAIGVWPEQRVWEIANAPEAIEQLVGELRALAPERIVLEGTGGLQAPVVAALGLAGLPVVVMNPRQIRDFAKGKGQRAKTDAIDALVLAEFGALHRPVVRPLADAETEHLSALVTRRRQLVENRRVEEQRLARLEAQRAGRRVRLDVTEHITWLTRRIDRHGHWRERQPVRPWHRPEPPWPRPWL